MHQHFGKLTLFGLSTLMLSACGGSGSTSTAPVPITKPVLTCQAPLVLNSAADSCVAPAPVVSVGAGQALLFFKKADGNYTGYQLHTWNNSQCDAYLPASVAASWEQGLAPTGTDPNYGAYWLLQLKDGIGSKATDCGNFIVHQGTSDSGKEFGGQDMQLPLGPRSEYPRTAFSFSGVNLLLMKPQLQAPVQISDSAAHWLDATTIVWNRTSNGAAKWQLHYSSTADLAVDDAKFSLNGQTVNAVATSLTDSQKAKVPHLASWSAYKLDLSAEQAKAIAKNQLVFASYDSANKLVAASYVQAAKVLDDLYTRGSQDADEAQLGLRYEGNNIHLAVWAPTARSVKLNVFDAAKNLSASHTMTLDNNSGVWSFSGSKSSLDRQFYRFEVQVYHPLTRKVETIQSTDPYSLNTSSNGLYSQFVNLADADTKPAGWDEQSIPVVSKVEDSVIYEGHIRDFSVRDQSVSSSNRGKYLAFTEANSEPVRHLSALAQQGLTHFHLLPAMDIASINETASARVDLSNTVGDLCKINSKASVCHLNASTQLLDVMKSFSPFSEQAQQLASEMRGNDSFNWGYDPQHFLTPEGSYASNPDGISRIVEMRAMNQALHQMGLRVVLDVVYNHTASSGLNEKSVFDKIVPGYYHRYHPVSGAIERSTCCENTATEHRMFDKFVSDSLVILARDYKFDGFRFDIMGHHPKASIVAARDAVRQVDPDTYFYGEGWNFGEVADDARFIQARQANLAGTELGSFNDRERDAVRGATLFSGKTDGATLKEQNFIEIGLAGTLKDYVLRDYQGKVGPASNLSWNSQPAGYALDPADIINYVSKHDNESLWDKLQLELGNDWSISQRVRINNIALAIPLLSQGIPFLQMGDDLLRSKSMDRNSYDAGDWFNFVDFSKQSNNWHVGLPLAQDNQGNWERIKTLINNPATAASPGDINFAGQVFQEFLQIRKQSLLLRLGTGAEIKARLGFHNSGQNLTPGLIVMSIDDGVGLIDLDPAVDAMLVVINGTNKNQTTRVPTAQNFVLHQVQQQSVDSTLQQVQFANDGSYGRVSVPPLSIAVLVKPQQGAQGVGLKADATLNAADLPPFGQATPYVRGDMNSWGTSDALSYVGAGVYQATVTINNAGKLGFKIGGSDWSQLDFGGQTNDPLQFGQATPLKAQGNNLSADFVSGSYVFKLDAKNTAAPTLTVQAFQPYGATVVYLRGSMNGWDTSMPFSYQQGRYQTTVTLNAGDYEFKFASSDWSTVNYGAGTSGNVVTLGEAKTLGQSNDNLKLKISQNGSYRFSVNAEVPSAPVLTVSQQ